jgi:dipeptidyl aminopeptidase/acylaminoacyl peptidase
VPRTLPYGEWPSPLAPAALVERSVGLSHPTEFAGRLWWAESRPSEAGRTAIVSSGAHGEDRREELPEGFGARSGVHEYGGRAWVPTPLGLVIANHTDQRLWLFPTDGGAAQALTAEPEALGADRFAEPIVSPDGRWLVAVRERHQPSGVLNDLVAVPLGGRGEPVVVADGHDFYAAPSFDATGRLAWIAWDHPNMPWDRTELWTATFADGMVGERVRRVEAAHSVLQPQWSPTGALVHISDVSGWWNLYAGHQALAPMAAEVGGPLWWLGESDHAFLPDGRHVAAWTAGGRQHLGVVAGGRAQALDLPWTSFAQLAPAGTADDPALLAVVASPSESPALVRIAFGPAGSSLSAPATVEVIRRSREANLGAEWVSTPLAITFPTGEGQEAHALFYAPRNPEVAAPEGTRPPLIVTSHGGPTGSSSSVLNLRTQFWTTRGFAVVDVDYRGSTGYGTAYRNALRGRWGEADVADCVAAAAWLAEAGQVDADRVVIRGSSASGLTALAALVGSERFAAATVLYGVTDLGTLAVQTHKFESRYTDGLVGPWPEAEDIYRARSPRWHVDEINVPVLFFQGLEDRVVPPAQAEAMVGALRARGVPVGYQTFEQEGHGFRRAESLIAVQEMELAFYGLVLGLQPAQVGRPPELVPPLS